MILRKKKKIIPLNSVNQQIFSMKKRCVIFEVGTTFLNTPYLDELHASKGEDPK
jgi:hypothetical protein